jgi:post-segregation antitoxin (ccd killing protein)
LVKIVFAFLFFVSREIKTKLITYNFPRMPSDAFTMSNKRNVVLYLDKELIEKSKELGFNLSKTFENHLKHLMTQFSTENSVDNLDLTDKNVSWCGRRDLNPGRQRGRLMS